jgi:hypothetical protein
VSLLEWLLGPIKRVQTKRLKKKYLVLKEQVVQAHKSGYSLVLINPQDFNGKVAGSFRPPMYRYQRLPNGFVALHWRRDLMDEEIGGAAQGTSLDDCFEKDDQV